MNLLIGCEYSGVVRDAFIARGHRAVSCDLLPTERPGPHIVGDVFDAIASEPWDALIVFPPCTFLCGSGLHWNKRRPERAEKTEEALEFVRRLLSADVPRIALENPVGCISTRLNRPATQTFQPYQFGEDASNRTCLWLKNLPPLKPTTRFPGRMVEWPRGSGKMVERWSNQTDSGQNALGPDENRGKDRAKTYQGVADAMAAQWGGAFASADLSLFAVRDLQPQHAQQGVGLRGRQVVAPGEVVIHLRPADERGDGNGQCVGGQALAIDGREDGVSDGVGHGSLPGEGDVRDHDGLGRADREIAHQTDEDAIPADLGHLVPGRGLVGIDRFDQADQVAGGELGGVRHAHIVSDISDIASGKSLDGRAA